MIASRYFVCIALLAVMAGCGSSSEDEIRQWVAEQRAQTRPKVEPIPEPKQFVPQVYSQGATIEPFSLQKLAQAFKRESTQVTANAALVAPEMARRKEALEAFPLDAMAMVGSLNKAGQPVGLLRLDNLLYQVRVGNYLGQNFGRITKIGETEILLREIVQDATGDWVERAASLQLQERSK
ncbi:MAG TPA: pilus assembly protein PilP [Burkholderiaceae bacterium]|nr:pilus assembly protein PilP [Burkholderiaceae bacterium]